MRELITPIAQWLARLLREELERQGHIATEKLLNSIEVAVEEITDGFEIQGSFLYYGKFVDTGRKPGGKKVPIDALIDWIRVKKIDLRGKSERSVAFAIQTSIHRNGIPTDGDPEKKRWMSGTLEVHSEELEQRIRAIANQHLSIMLDNLIERSQKMLNETELAA